MTTVGQQVSCRPDPRSVGSKWISEGRLVFSNRVRDHSSRKIREGSGRKEGKSVPRPGEG